MGVMKRLSCQSALSKRQCQSPENKDIRQERVLLFISKAKRKVVQLLGQKRSGISTEPSREFKVGGSVLVIASRLWEELSHIIGEAAQPKAHRVRGLIKDWLQ